ncbi:MAG: S-layer homology domain-containing protein [Syntrophomonadaceae bacterium]|nr:S-layer homology domain-containing protein [Syntrophomonadaceae bacterium]
MCYLTRKRLTAGNICLVVFVAFLALVLFGTAGPVGSAQAAPSKFTDSSGNDLGSTEIQASSRSSVQLQLHIVPVSTDFDSIWLNLSNLDPAKIQVYVSDMIYGNVSGNIYSIAYNLAPGVDFPWNTAVAVYIYDPGNLSPVDVINVLFRPPSGGGGGGGGGAPTQTQNTDTGTVVYNPSTGQSVVGVDPGKVSSQIASNPGAKEVTIEIPASIASKTKEARVDIPLQAVKIVEEAAKNLVLKTPEVVMTIPPAALLVPEVQQLEQAGAKVEVSISVKEAAAEVRQQLAETLNQPQNQAYTAVGKVFELTFTVTADSGTPRQISSFNGKIEVGIPYNDAGLNGASEDNLGAYKVLVNGFEYRMSRVDKANNIVYFSTDGFSSYVLMAYEKTFADLVGHWARADIELMAAKHIARGVSDDQFMPDRTITRAEFATMLQRVLGLPLAAAGSATFSDVGSGDWYFASVEAAAKAGLVNGYGDGSFKPLAPISRQEMAALVTRAMKIAGRSTAISAEEASSILARFRDAAAIQGWAREASAIAVKEGIVNGRSADEYAPGSNATRAEGMTMIKRMMASTGML